MVWKRRLYVLGACCLCTGAVLAQQAQKPRPEPTRKPGTTAAQPRDNGKQQIRETPAPAIGATQTRGAEKQAIAAQQEAARIARKQALASLPQDQPEGPGPANNACAAAIGIGEGTTAFDTTGATTDGPSPCGALGNDIWYNYTATCTGTATVSLCASSYDTVVAVYNGCACPVGAAIVCNDDFCNGLESQVSLAVTSGTCYKIQVGGFGGSTGAGSMTISCAGGGGGPPNDNCAMRIPIGDGATAFSTVGATTDGPPHAACNDGFADPQVNQDIWYNYTATCSGNLTVSLCGSSYDTKLAVYNGCACPVSDGNLLGCTDDFCGLQSQVPDTGQPPVVVTAGNCYKIRVGGFGGATGSGTITITCGGGGGNPACPSPGSCCVAHAGVGCDNADCCNIVCAADSFCCNVSWDGICAGEAGTMCGALCACAPPACPAGGLNEAAFDPNCGLPPAGGSNCCVAHAGTGCDDAACQAIVCAADSFCCNVAWDGICAGEAAAMCGALCAAGSDPDGGCNVTPNAFFSPNLVCGNSVCGSGAAAGGTRDTDWYTITVTSNTALTWTGTAVFPLAVAILDANCPPGILNFVTGSACFPVTSTANVAAGTYHLFAAPNTFDGVACPSAYVATVTCAAGPPPPPGDNCADALVAVDGNNPYDTSNATTDGIQGGCPQAFKDLWYHYTATCSMTAVVSTCGAAGDSVLYAYDGCNTANCPPTGELACNDDSCGLLSMIQFPVTQGNCYTIRVGNFGAGGTSAGNMNIFCGQAPSNCCSAHSGTGCDCQSCQNIVCAADSFCCNVAWDGICAGEAQSMCGALCSGGECPPPPPPPANDNCVDRILVCDGDTPFTTVGATTDGPPHALCSEGFVDLQVNQDIWFNYNASCSGGLLVSLCMGTTYDSKLAVYNGCDCGNINDGTLLACADDTCGTVGGPSQVTILAVAGNCYKIRVGGFLGATGSGVLHVQCGVAPPPPCPPVCPAGSLNEAAFDPNCGLAPAGGSNCCFAHAGTGCDDAACQAIVCAADSFCCNVSWDGICAGEAAAMCGALCAAGADPDGGCNVTPNAFFSPDLVCGNSVCGSYAASGGTRDTDWYTVTVTQNTQLTWTVEGTAVTASAVLDANCPPTILNFVTGPACVNVTSTACVNPGTYHLFAAPNTFDGVACPSTYVATLTCAPCAGAGSNCCFAHAGTGCDDAACQAIVCGADSFCCNVSWDAICAGEAQAMCGALCGGGGGPPANDNCAARIVLSGNGSTPFSTVGATTDGPSLCGALGNDIWYNYTAPGTGSLTVTTCGSTYDTVVAVYDGCSCPPGANLACNDDSCGLQSSVTVAVTSGSCYKIQVGGFASSTGSGTLNIMGPAGPPPSIASSNPPNGLLDPLQPNPAPCAMCTLSQGVGAAGTPVEGTVQYAPIRVTFSSAPTTTPSTCNTELCCTGGSCPTITAITAVNATTFDVSLSGAIPPLQCSTLQFAGGQFVQWISHPANINGDGFSNTQDLLAIVQALNNGTANLPANLHQYDVNRSGATNTQDLLREVQLLNGTQTLQVYNGSTHAACPAAGCP